MDNDIINKIDSKLKSLPTLPVVAMKILEVTENPKSTINELKEIIMMDQVVTGRILRAVNSAYYGFPRKVDSLSQAIVILGFNNVRSLALSVSVMDLFSAKHGSGVIEYQQLWKHSVGTAFIARALAKSRHPRLAEQCFVAGLLHDIGFIPMDQSAPNEILKAKRHAEEKRISVYAAEKEMIGFTHADVGGWMAERWLLPATLKEPISVHHDPPGAPESPEIALTVHAADVFAKLTEFECFENEDFGGAEAINEPARRMFNITDAIPTAAKGFLNDDLEEARGLLSIFI